MAQASESYTEAARQLADRHSQIIPAEDPDYGDLGPVFLAWTGPAKDAILQPPKPEIPPSRTSCSAPPTVTPAGKLGTDSDSAHPHAANLVLTDLTTGPSAPA
jgi:hypothetical protein